MIIWLFFSPMYLPPEREAVPSVILAPMMVAAYQTAGDQA